MNEQKQERGEIIVKDKVECGLSLFHIRFVF